MKPYACVCGLGGLTLREGKGWEAKGKECLWAFGRLVKIIFLLWRSPLNPVAEVANWELTENLSPDRSNYPNRSDLALRVFWGRVTLFPPADVEETVTVSDPDASAPKRITPREDAHHQTSN